MTEELNTGILKKRKFLGINWTKKKIIWTIIILLVALPIAYKIFKPNDNSANIQTEAAKMQNLKSTVLATGQVVSSTDLSLSFKTSGVVQSVAVKEGGKVTAGSVLATLDQRDAAASLTSARGALAAAQANYNKVLAGASNEDVALVQVTLDNAKSALEITKNQQQVLVDNALKALMNSGLAAIPGTYNSGSITATISGAYAGSTQGVYRITIDNTGSGVRFHTDGLENSGGVVSLSPQPMGTKGLFLSFSDSSVSQSNTWTVTIPNTQSSTYVTNYNAYQAALQTQSSTVAAAQNAVTSAQASLDLKKAKARPVDLEAAQAQILSAQGQVQAAQAAVENGIIRAPTDSPITLVDVKVGELATALKEVFILQDVGSLHVEANVSEANIAQLKSDQAVDITFDALGADRHFIGKLQTVNPGATVVSGVVNYKITASMDNIPGIKPGMTANMTILVDQKEKVLAVPLRGVISRDDKKFVRVIDDPKKKTYHEVEIKTGMEADGGLVEITEGLKEGQEIVTFVKK